MSDFDDMFRKGLHDHKVDVPDDLWSRIDQEVNPKKKYRKAFALLAAGLLAFCSLCYLATSSFGADEKSMVESNPTPTIKANQDPANALKELLIATSDYEINPLDEPKEGLLIIEKDQITRINNNSQNKIQKALKREVGEEEPKLIEERNLISIETKTPSEKLSGSSLLSEVTSSTIPTSLLEKESLVSFPTHIDMDWSLQQMPEYDRKCPKFGNSKTGYFSIELYHSSDRILRQLSSKSSEYEEYADMRNNSETAMYSFSNGIGITWHHSQGIGIGLGVERSQINELFSFVEQDAREVRVLISIDTLFNTDGTFSTSIDTMRIEVQGVKKNYVANQYTSIDLPITMSYRWKREKWSFGVRGAVYLNLLFNQKGRVLGLNGKPAWISEGTENELDAYRAKSGLKFDGSIDVSYNFTPLWAIYAQPYFRYNGNTYTRDSYQLDHFMNTMGIRAGVRYNFGL